MFDPDEISSRRKTGIKQNSRPKLFTAAQVKSSIEERQDAPEVIGSDKKNPILIIHSTYPRVAKRIIEFWNSNELGNYLHSIVFMDRMDRSGFPHEVMQAILELSRISEKTEGKMDENNPWLIDPHLDKAFKKEEIEGSMQKSSSRSFLNGKDAALIDAFDEGFIKKN